MATGKPSRASRTARLMRRAAIVKTPSTPPRHPFFHEPSHVQCIGDTPGLDRATFTPHRRQAFYRIFFCFQYYAPPTLQTVSHDHRGVRCEVDRQVKPEERRGHVFHVGPDEIAVPVVHDEVALLAGYRGAHVIDERFRNVPGAAAEQAQPKA